MTSSINIATANAVWFLAPTKEVVTERPSFSIAVMIDGRSHSNCRLTQC